MGWRVALAALALATAAGAGGQTPGGADAAATVEGRAYGRFVDRTADWEQAGGDLIRNFVNMYHLFIIRDADDRQRPYHGWFFGWSAEAANTSFGHGCDAVFACRAPGLTGPWEVYCGGGKWDATMTPRLWKPVLMAGNEPWNQWHNGDSSVVKVGRRYFMAYSSTGHNQDGIPFGQPGDRDSDLNCIMGATSEDGLTWKPTRAPILIYAPNIGAPLVRPGEYMPADGLYHRPSLRREGGVWRLWFDCFTGTDMPMAYAENRGDFTNPEEWRVLRGHTKPVLANFPNPDVVRVKDVLFAYGDPGGYKPLAPPAGTKFDAAWASRKILEAVSLNGLDWCPLGYIERDADAQANEVPVAYVERAGRDHWIYVNYGAQVFGSYCADRIRMKRRRVTAADLAVYRTLWRRAYGGKIGR